MKQKNQETKACDAFVSSQRNTQRCLAKVTIEIIMGFVIFLHLKMRKQGHCSVSVTYNQTADEPRFTPCAVS